MEILQIVKHYHLSESMRRAPFKTMNPMITPMTKSGI
jgi:hypothetical protein